MAKPAQDIALLVSESQPEVMSDSPAWVARKLECFKARVYISGAFSDRRTLKIGPEVTQEFGLFSFCDVAGRLRTGFFEVFGGSNLGRGISAGLYIEPGFVSLNRLIQLCQMLVQAAELVLLPAATAYAGTRRKIAAPVTHVGFLA